MNKENSEAGRSKLCSLSHGKSCALQKYLFSSSTFLVIVNNFWRFFKVSYLDHLELERLRGEVVLKAEVDLSALLAGLSLLVVHVHQRDAAVVPEGQLKKKYSSINQQVFEGFEGVG